jgi:hypothetical protein
MTYYTNLYYKFIWYILRSRFTYTTFSLVYETLKRPFNEMLPVSFFLLFCHCENEIPVIDAPVHQVGTLGELADVDGAHIPDSPTGEPSAIGTVRRPGGIIGGIMRNHIFAILSLLFGEFIESVAHGIEAAMLVRHSSQCDSIDGAFGQVTCRVIRTLWGPIGATVVFVVIFATWLYRRHRKLSRRAAEAKKAEANVTSESNPNNPNQRKHEKKRRRKSSNIPIIITVAVSAIFFLFGNSRFKLFLNLFDYVDRDNSTSPEAVRHLYSHKTFESDAFKSFRSLKSGHGLFLSVTPDGRLAWNQILPSRSEMFEIIRFKGSKYAFRTCFNTFLSNRPGIGLNANATEISRYEVFGVIPKNEYVVLVAWNGDYVRIKKNGRVICKGKGDHETAKIRIV